MVACNPRDREAAHRAQVEGIATENPQAVTCKKCWTVMRSTGKQRPSRNSAVKIKQGTIRQPVNEGDEE